MSEISNHWESSTKPSFVTRLFSPFKQAFSGFIEDDCYSKASALTFYCLLSIVPFLAVFFGIAKGFGFEKALEAELNTQFAEQPELLNRLIGFANSWLQSVQGGIIAGFGTLALFWSVLGLLSNIEKNLNAIWKVPYSRSFIRRISDYLAMIVICPIFLVVSASVTVFLNTQITETAQNNSIIALVSPFFLSLLRLFPFFLSVFLFSFIYLLIPNTQVSIRGGLIAGLLGGTTFQLWQWIYIKFQIGVASYGAVYGSFAALPLFLIWLQISWLILLGGAEVAYAIQCRFFHPLRSSIPLSDKAIALLIVHRCAEAFIQGEDPLTHIKLFEELGISFQRFHRIMDALEKGKILLNTSTKENVQGVQIARNPTSLTYALICQTIERQEEQPAFIDSSSLTPIWNYLNQEKAVLESEAFQKSIVDENISK